MVDPRTPVIVGVGQFTERIDLDGYRGMSSVELATEAARAALHDCGADAAAVAQAIDTVAGTRQFEISGHRRQPWVCPTTTRARWRATSAPRRPAPSSK